MPPENLFLPKRPRFQSRVEGSSGVRLKPRHEKIGNFPYRQLLCQLYVSFVLYHMKEMRAMIVCMGLFQQASLRLQCQ